MLAIRKKELPTSRGILNVRNFFEYIIDPHTFSGALGGLTRVVQKKRVGLEGGEAATMYFSRVGLRTA
jgi:hypothetical protein